MKSTEIIDRFRSLVRRTLPLAKQLAFVVEKIGRDRSRVRLPFKGQFIRSGNTISGPILMALADFTAYAALFGRGGDMEDAVTSNLSIAFLRRPSPGDLIAEARVLRRGGRLAYAETGIRSAVDRELVAHATVTYATPANSLKESAGKVRGNIQPRR